MSRPDGHSAAFSLVEVTLALGIMAFCLVAIFGLLPTGLNTSRDAISQTAAANIAGAISADLRQTPAATTTTPNPQSPRFLITVPSASTLATATYVDPATNASHSGVVETLFLTEDGTVADVSGTSAQNNSAKPSYNPRYRAALMFSRLSPSSPSTGPAASTDRIATSVRILITWPALADPSGGSLPVHGNSSFETMIALARN